MLDVMEAIKQRRSIRSFEDKPVSREMILQMLEAARLAPSGGNQQPWRFIVVTDEAEKKELSQLCLGQSFIEEAAVVFVVCTDFAAFSKAEFQRRYGELGDARVKLSGHFGTEEFQKWLQSMAEPSFRSIFTRAIANTFIATEHLILAATGLGLGSCWVGAVTDKKAMMSFFALPDNIKIVSLVAVGYPQEKVVPPPRPRLPMEKLLLRPLPDGG